MKKIGNRILYEKPSKDELVVEIIPFIEKKSFQLLKLWAIAYSFCGIVLYAIQWNRRGKEIVTIKDGIFSYVKQLSERGIPFEISIDKMKPFCVVEDTENGFWNEINNSTFIVGGEAIEYNSDESVKRLGIKLVKKDAIQLVNLLNKTAKF